MIVQRNISLLFAGASILFLTGCSSINLSRVHDAYEDEFRASLASTETRPAEVTYPNTTARIAELRAKNPDDQTKKHLAVLEAMIFVDSGSYDRARAAIAAPDLVPIQLATSDGRSLRDEMLYEALTARSSDGRPAGLIEAFELIENRLDQTGPEPLARVGEALEAVVDRAVREDRVSREDDGALYVATAAALTYYHAGDLRERTVRPPDSIPVADRSTWRRQQAREFYESGVNVITPFLSQEERIAVENDRPLPEGPRRRYLSVYTDLSARLD